MHGFSGSSATGVSPRLNGMLHGYMVTKTSCISTQEIHLEMPQDYRDHALCKQVKNADNTTIPRKHLMPRCYEQVRILIEEEVLYDTAIVFK